MARSPGRFGCRLCRTEPVVMARPSEPPASAGVCGSNADLGALAAGGGRIAGCRGLPGEAETDLEAVRVVGAQDAVADRQERGARLIVRGTPGARGTRMAQG
jgi:hypothetical protein